MTHNREIQAGRDYHRATNHSELSLRSEPHYLDFENQPTPFKVYTTLEPIPLPADIARTNVPALEALRMFPDDDADARVPTLADLARVLYLGAGVLRRKQYARGEMFFRSYANTGALYHIDLYLVCGDLPDLPAGVYHFGPHDFALRRLREGDFRAVLVDATGGEPRVAKAPAVLVSASTYWRNAWKYRARTYRHCFWDAGTMHANLLATATTGGLAPRVVMGFADQPVERLLGLNPEKEGALTLVPLGRVEDAPPPAPDMPVLDLDTLPLSKREIDYPPVHEMHLASSLATGAEAAAWRACLPEAAAVHAVDGRVIALDATEPAPAEPFEQAIMRRGSTRTFDRTFALSSAQLLGTLQSATAPIPADFLSDTLPFLCDLYVIVQNVQDVPPGAYYYRREAGALELLRAGDFRATAGRLGLFQDLPADAAVNIFALTDLERVLAAFGNRGYRAAQMEGGIMGGRMYCASYAQHFGATGLTFLDDEVTEFFSPHAAGKSVMFLTALGRSIKKRASA